jgi:hypothetical protein
VRQFGVQQFGVLQLGVQQFGVLGIIDALQLGVQSLAKSVSSCYTLKNSEHGHRARLSSLQNQFSVPFRPKKF